MGRIYVPVEDYPIISSMEKVIKQLDQFWRDRPSPEAFTFRDQLDPKVTTGRGAVR